MAKIAVRLAAKGAGRKDRMTTGIYPIAPTPFTATGALDPDGMRRVMDCVA